MVRRCARASRARELRYKFKMEDPRWWAVSVPSSKINVVIITSLLWLKVINAVGANFFSFCFSFLHLLVIVYSFSFRSGISLITLLCYVLYVNFVIVYYLALIYYQFYGSFSVTTFVEVGFFLGGPDHQPCIPQHLVSSFVFIVFSLISFCSRFKVVFLYCNYYFFAFCRNLLFLWFRNSKTFADCDCCCDCSNALAN